MQVILISTLLDIHGNFPRALGDYSLTLRPLGTGCGRILRDRGHVLLGHGRGLLMANRGPMVR